MAQAPERSFEKVIIEALAPGGSGVGRRQSGQVVFIPGTLPGEEIEVEIGRDHGSWAEGKAVQVLVPARQRVGPPCPYFGRCGGCQLQHAHYEFQLELKKEIVEHNLSRIGKIPNPPVHPVLPSPLIWAYRNRIAVHCDGQAVGFYATGTRRVIDVERCLIASEELNRQLADLRKQQRPGKGTRVLREPSPFRGFRQVNAGAADVLLREVLRRLEAGGSHLVEAFCGGGFFTAPASAYFHKVTAIEWSSEAVAAARQSCPANTTVLEGDAAILLPRLLENHPADFLLVDPPAEGLPPEIITAILKNPPAQLLYVSCDSATFARDLYRLRANYLLEEVQPVDMFPQTSEIECLGVLHRAC